MSAEWPHRSTDFNGWVASETSRELSDLHRAYRVLWHDTVVDLDRSYDVVYHNELAQMMCQCGFIHIQTYDDQETLVHEIGQLMQAAVQSGFVAGGGSVSAASTKVKTMLEGACRSDNGTIFFMTSDRYHPFDEDELLELANRVQAEMMIEQRPISPVTIMNGA